MSRLASFRGPSTPTSSPAKPQTTPSSPARPIESTYHRKTRTLLFELRSAGDTWEDLVLFDGLKAAQGLVDTRTDLDNTLKLVQDGLPRTHVVGPKLARMDKYIDDLDVVIAKLRRQFDKMNNALESLEQLLIEAHKTKGWKWVSTEPLWATWSLEKFVTEVPNIIPLYHRSLHLHIELVKQLREHSVSFEDSRDIITRWAEQPWLENEGWGAYWDDLCEAEVEGWRSR